MLVEGTDAEVAGQAGGMEQNAGGAPIEPVEKRRSWRKWNLPHAVVMRNEAKKSTISCQVSGAKLQVQLRVSDSWLLILIL